MRCRRFRPKRTAVRERQRTIKMLIGYARVSTIDQDLALQTDALARAGCERIFADKASGAKTDRPGLTEALQFLRTGDTLVIWKLDRLGRSIRGLIDLAAGLSDRKIDFRSLTDGFDTATPSGRLLFHILASVAEMERELIRERTIAGLAAARAKGGTGGGRKPTMTADKIDTARKLLAAGDKPAKIAKLLQVGLSTFYRHCPSGS
ncbi:DNA invertase Pin-like site-specific DNA recombinase [Sphingomonas sp. SORGH_AS 950]|nr:DNA invertase Pin-like site-specific DNA recombinase [Sphingomonas sp. SORGH_AS_0950]